MLDDWCERDVFVDEVEDPLGATVVEQRRDVNEADAHLVGADRPWRVELVGLSPADPVLHPLDLVVVAAPVLEVDVGDLIDGDVAATWIVRVLALMLEDPLDAVA